MEEILMGDIFHRNSHETMSRPAPRGAVCPTLFCIHYAYGELASRRRNSPSPPPPNGGHDNSGKNCIIPGCPYPAYHNYADQEQTEYCGQGHELCVFV